MRGKVRMRGENEEGEWKGEDEKRIERGKSDGEWGSEGESKSVERAEEFEER
jgi:hypothetical protein